MAKKKNTTKRAKELKRVKQFIRRAEKRGYIFTAEFKQSIEGKTTRGLQFLTPRRLYEQAQYEVLPGEYVGGLQGRWREREESARKARETRERKKREREQPPLTPPEPPVEAPPISDIVYRRVLALIDEYPSRDGAQYLQNLLDSEIRTYGESLVIQGMAAAGESLIKLAEEIVYYELNSWQLHEALQAFSQIIRGGIALTKKESKELNETMEAISDES